MNDFLKKPVSSEPCYDLGVEFPPNLNSECQDYLFRKSHHLHAFQSDYECTEVQKAVIRMHFISTNFIYIPPLDYYTSR